MACLPLHPPTHPTASSTIPGWVEASRTTRLRRSFHIPGPHVDAIGYGASYSVLFASEADVQNDEPFVPTRRVKVHPPTDAEARALMVHGTDPFEVRLAGVQAASKDKALLGKRKNELVIYSVHRDPSGQSADGVPLVHYDFATARESTAAGVYFPIPASKSVVARGGVAACGGPMAACIPRSHLNVRLVVLEVDDVATLKRSVESIENLTGGLAALSSSLGVVGGEALEPAIRLAGAMSRGTLLASFTASQSVLRFVARVVSSAHRQCVRRMPSSFPLPSASDAARLFCYGRCNHFDMACSGCSRSPLIPQRPSTSMPSRTVC